MKRKEIEEMAVKDLRERLEVERQNLNKMKMNHVISPLEDTSKIKKSRKDIARMITILAQKEKEQK
jgi:large subunit ribosomal protein L29